MRAHTHIHTYTHAHTHTHEQVIFRKGYATAQTVVVAHKQRGEATLTFEIDGGNYRGLATATVHVATLSSYFDD